MALAIDDLRQRLVGAASQTFEAVRAANPGESFYAFALYTTDDYAGINPSTNSEQASIRVGPGLCHRCLRSRGAMSVDKARARP